MPQRAPAIPLAPAASAHLSLAPARTRVYLYVLSFGGFKPNPPRPQSALRRPPRPRRRRLSSPPAATAAAAPSTDSPAKLAPKSTGAHVLRVLIATSGHRSRAVHATPYATPYADASRITAAPPGARPARVHDKGENPKSESHSRFPKKYKKVPESESHVRIVNTERKKCRH